MCEQNLKFFETRIIQQDEPFRFFNKFIGEFDPGSGRTLAACLTHASRTRIVFITELIFGDEIQVVLLFVIAEHWLSDRHNPSGKRVSNA